MIHVFFVPGMFGTTVEYVLRNYTKEYEKVSGYIRSDGSMHSFFKEHHVFQKDHLLQKNLKLRSDSITTPMYPFNDLRLEEILKKFPLNDSRCILIHSNDLKCSELNLLFQYYKIANGAKLKLGLGLFFNGIDNNSAKNWNKLYRSWGDMHRWEQREWFSIFYPDYVNDWINSPLFVDETWKVISNIEFLDNTLDTFREIIKFCNLTEDYGLLEFATEWRDSQQYIMNEFNLLDSIINKTLLQKNFNWCSLNIISESIIQQRLRSLGYEIRCNGLNTFPTDSKTLYNLLEPA
jgi:hypothetical protein